MKVHYQVFRSSFQKWEDLFEQASKFASTIPHECLISISQSSDQLDSLVTVWYWGK